ncbi:MAG: hypothetical protein WBX27_05555, partial [Specibacter sp.]
MPPSVAPVEREQKGQWPVCGQRSGQRRKTAPGSGFRTPLWSSRPLHATRGPEPGATTSQSPGTADKMERMSQTLPPCPECASEYTYGMGDLLVCPECAHEWAPGQDTAETE